MSEEGRLKALGVEYQVKDGIIAYRDSEESIILSKGGTRIKVYDNQELLVGSDKVVIETQSRMSAKRAELKLKRYDKETLNEIGSVSYNSTIGDGVSDKYYECGVDILKTGYFFSKKGLHSVIVINTGTGKVTQYDGCDGVHIVENGDAVFHTYCQGELMICRVGYESGEITKVHQSAYNRDEIGHSALTRGVLALMLGNKQGTRWGDQVVVMLRIHDNTVKVVTKGLEHPEFDWNTVLYKFHMEVSKEIRRIIKETGRSSQEADMYNVLGIEKLYSKGLAGIRDMQS